MVEKLRLLSPEAARTATTLVSSNSPRPVPSPIPLSSITSATSLKLSEKREEVPLDFRLPPLIERTHEGWIKACDSGTVATTILASIAVSVWIHLQEKLKDSPPALPANSWQSALLLIVAYMGVIANCSATITSFLIIDRFVELPLSAAKRMQAAATGTHHDESIIELFELYLGWRLWNPFKAYWILNVTLGILLIFAEFLIYLWVWESLMCVKITVTVFTAFGLLSFVAYFGEGVIKIVQAKRPKSVMTLSFDPISPRYLASDISSPDPSPNM